MTKQAEAVAHNELVGGGQTSLHSHAGGGGASFVVSGTQVFSGDSPSSWTDLDLSGVVGSNSALVMLRIHAGSDMNAVCVRMNGDTVEYYSAVADSSAQGVALAHHDSTNAIVLMVVTDTSGVIEWRTEASQTATIDIIAYIT